MNEGRLPANVERAIEAEDRSKALTALRIFAMVDFLVATGWGITHLQNILMRLEALLRVFHSN